MHSISWEKHRIFCPPVARPRPSSCLGCGHVHFTCSSIRSLGVGWVRIHVEKGFETFCFLRSPLITTFLPWFFCCFLHSVNFLWRLGTSSSSPPSHHCQHTQYAYPCPGIFVPLFRLYHLSICSSVTILQLGWQVIKFRDAFQRKAVFEATGEQESDSFEDM